MEGRSQEMSKQQEPGNSDLVRPGDDVDLLSAIPIPLSVIPPGPISYGSNLTIAGMDCEKVSLSLQTLVADDNLGSSMYPPNKKLKKSSIYPVAHCNSQRDKLSSEDYLVSLCPSSVEQRLYEGSYSVMQSDAAVTVAIWGPKEASSSNAVDNRRRRAKISEGIKALEENTPQFGKGSKESVLDNVIDYIKYLKLQITALSQSRLGGEPIYHPFVHLEGFGHYMLHQQMPSEPLEEVVGRLMDSNMPLAVQLLESKGLELLPISSADAIVKASADKFS